MKSELKYPDGKRLPQGHNSLAFGVKTPIPGAVYLLALGGGYSVGPKDGRIVYFGRNKPEVHVCIGEDDRQVSRVHGELSYRDGRWWLTNTGRRPIRLPRSQWLFANEAAIPLSDGYTPLLIPGVRDREHLLEVYVIGPDGAQPIPRHSDETEAPRPYHLNPDEKLILVVLGQRYLLNEVGPRPLTWQQAARQLAELQPEGRWTTKMIEYRVSVVRDRLSKAGVSRLTREEVGEPVGNALNDNLLKELVRSTTLVPQDLAVLDKKD